jgi:hypothetical protein
MNKDWLRKKALELFNMSIQNVSFYYQLLLFILYMSLFTVSWLTL